MATKTTEIGKKQMFMLKSFNGDLFEVDAVVASKMQTIKNMLEDDCVNNEIPLHNVTISILSKVIEYCKKHTQLKLDVIDNKPIREELKSWDADFIKVDHITLFELIQAANYLNIKGLLDLSFQVVAEMIKNKSPEEKRTILNIENDFTPKEEEEVRRENGWALV